MAGDHALLDEVVTALGSTGRHGVRATWLEGDRRRLLPYLAVGGSFVGLLVGGAGARLGGDKGLLAVGLAAGIAVGMTVGWVVLGLARGLPLEGRARITLRLVRAGLSIPTYLAAGVASVVAILLVAGAGDRIPSTIPGTLVALVGLGLILLPTSFAMARRGGPAPIAATNLGDAINETFHASQESPRSGLGRFTGNVIAGLIWSVVATFAMLGLIGTLQSLDPVGYAAALASSGTLFGILLLTAWVATIVAGTRFTVRAIFGDGPRR
jgi:hypothetical protein